MKYYAVEAKCGHVGKNNCIYKTFAVIADNGREAAGYVRYLPRVKHDHRDAIVSVTEIDKDEYSLMKTVNDSDPFFKCKNIQQQRMKEYIGDVMIDESLAPKKKKRSYWKMRRSAELERECVSDIRGYRMHDAA